MRWEELSAKQFESAVETCSRVCIVPIGVLEYHGPHLPLGTDMIRAHRLACDVAHREPAVVFPVLPFSVNTECKIYPGGVVTRDNLMFELLENVCDEIARNGLHKVILLSAHGGNKWFLPLFVQLMLDKEKEFIPYYLSSRGPDPQAIGGYLDTDVFDATLETRVHGHADEWESSEMLYLQPELVHLEEVEGRSWDPQDRLLHLPNTYTPTDWFARQPDHTRGQPGPATMDKGRALWTHQVERLADLVKAIKADNVSVDLYREFTNRIYQR